MFRVIWQPDTEPNDFKWDCKTESVGTRTLVNTVNGLVLRFHADRKHAANEGGSINAIKAGQRAHVCCLLSSKTHTHTGS